MDRLCTQDLAAALSAVDQGSCRAYREQTSLLISYANQQMAARPDLDILLGPCPLKTVYRNHIDHAHIIAAQLELKSVDTLITTLTWVYRTHQLRGIATHAFPINMDIWRQAVEQHLEPVAAAQIGAVYHCIAELHNLLVLEAQAPEVQMPDNTELRPHIQRYLRAILKPDSRAALEAAEAYIHSSQEIATWWEHVIGPTLYEIGNLWAQGEISVGQEHLATAITQRVMAHYYPQILDQPREKGRVVVTSSPGELHEIGARILADLLELHGWDTYYTGANTPAESIVTMLSQHQACCLCISTTLSESLPAVTELICEVRAAQLNPAPKILVGGQAYLSAANLWKQVGADWFAYSANEGITYIENIQS